MGFPRQLGGLPGCLEFYGPLVGLAARARGGVASTGQGVVCPGPVAVLGPGSPTHTPTVKLIILQILFFFFHRGNQLYSRCLLSH